MLTHFIILGNKEPSKININVSQNVSIADETV
jgi:hypothetical protein